MSHTTTAHKPQKNTVDLFRINLTYTTLWSRKSYVFLSSSMRVSLKDFLLYIIYIFTFLSSIFLIQCQTEKRGKNRTSTFLFQQQDSRKKKCHITFFLSPPPPLFLFLWVIFFQYVFRHLSKCVYIHTIRITYTCVFV